MPILSSLWHYIREEYLSPLLDLLYPPTCSVCGGELTSGKQHICTSCMLEAPLTYYWRENRTNPMLERIQNMRPEIEYVASLIFYIHGSPWRDMIHRFKYREEFGQGWVLGRWMGREFRDSSVFDDVEYVVAVPLHAIRHLGRGYNQSESIARGVAEAMGCKYLSRGIYRTRHNSAQASTSKIRRWDNVEGLFSVDDVGAFADRNVLLIDDVFTTGATIMSCAEAILDAAPTCRLWIATFAVSKAEFQY